MLRRIETKSHDFKKSEILKTTKLVLRKPRRNFKKCGKGRKYSE
jgi:hypothetical protein